MVPAKCESVQVMLSPRSKNPSQKKKIGIEIGIERRKSRDTAHDRRSAAARTAKDATGTKIEKGV